MTESNMALWKEFKRPPASALKQIQAGRLKGKSDINPMWRYELLTQHFGPCGEGWKFTIDRLWAEHAASGEVFAFALVSLYWRHTPADNWSDAVVGVGGSKLSQVEGKNRDNPDGHIYNNDEGYKMAITDALGTACKVLGVAADVYMGLWDGSKYRDAPKAAPGQQPRTQAAAGRPPATDDDKATEKQVGKLNAMITEYGLERAEVKAMLKVTSLKDLTKARASKLFDGWDSFIDLYNKRTGAGDE